MTHRSWDATYRQEVTRVDSLKRGYTLRTGIQKKQMKCE